MLVQSLYQCLVVSLPYLTKIMLSSIPHSCQKWWESSRKPKLCSLPHTPGKSPLVDSHSKFSSLPLTTGSFLPINYFHVRIQEKLRFQQQSLLLYHSYIDLILFLHIGLFVSFGGLKRKLIFMAISNQKDNRSIYYNIS